MEVSSRIGMRKLDAMTDKDFVEFLSELQDSVCSDMPNFLDFSKVSITEKIDGNAICLIFTGTDLLFESSYSGIVTWDKMPFPEQTKWIYNHFKDKKLGQIKILGELIWTYHLTDSDNTITQVTVTYNAKHFGKFGSIIIRDIQDFEGNSFPIEEQRIIGESLSDEDFNFYHKYQLDFNWTELPTDLTREGIVEYYRTKMDKMLNGHFNENNNFIEGIVFTFKKTGNEYGLFHRHFKEVKHKYHKYSEAIEDLIKAFLYNVFGNKTIAAIARKWNPNIDYQNA